MKICHYYVATAFKSSSVSDSASGNFTGSNEVNLIVAKGKRLEVFIYADNRLKPLLDCSIKGRIRRLQLFRPRGERQDLLFVLTEMNEYFVLQWDPLISQTVTRSNSGSFECMKKYLEEVEEAKVQIAIIDPDCRLIGLHLFVGFLEVIPLDETGKLKKASRIKLKEQFVLDIKFLFGCKKPTAVVLYKVQKDEIGEYDYRVKTYVMIIKDEEICSSEGLWSIELNNKAGLLIPVPSPLYGILIIGNESVQYFSSSASKVLEFINATTRYYTRYYGRLDADDDLRDDDLKYLLGDRNGLLHMLVISQGEKKSIGLNVQYVGETAPASTISSVGNEAVYVGSDCGPSQLIKISPLPDEDGSCVEALERYANLGPIWDLCVVDSERHGKGTIVTCSGSAESASICMLRYGFGIDKLASEKLEGITGMWSLRSATADCLLVVSFIHETRILQINSESELEEIENKGFSSEVKTLFCHEALHDQLIQVTSSSVRLVSSSSRELLDEWKTPDISINVATANMKQVLFAGLGYLVYLEIGVGVLKEVKYEKIKYDVSCLDISPIGEDPDCSQLAAVGVWMDTCVRIFSLPNLQLLTKEHLGKEIVRSVLLCKLEGISYMLCALGDGHLLNFTLNQKSGHLTDMKKVSLGSRPISLCTFSSNSTQIFAASNKPAVIYSSNKRLLYSSVVNLKEVHHACPLYSTSFPNSLAFAENDELIIGTVEYPMLRQRVASIPVKERACRICHQDCSQSFALYCEKLLKPGGGFIGTIYLLNDQTLEFKSNFPLKEYEFCSSIISCSFADDNNVYYCVGTGYMNEYGGVIEKGGVRVLSVKNGVLILVAQMEMKNDVGSLNAFQGKLLVTMQKKMQLYRWMLGEGGYYELQFECENGGMITSSYVNVDTRGNVIVVGGTLDETLSVLIYKPEKSAIEVDDRHYENWSMAVKILGDDLYLGSDVESNIFTVCKSEVSSNQDEFGGLEMVGRYNLGEVVNRIQHGSLLMGILDSSCIFGTESGAIGTIVSVTKEQFYFLNKLQSVLGKVLKSVGGLGHVRSFISSTVEGEVKLECYKNFLDGDLIESFLDLTPSEMESVSSAMVVPVKELEKTVQDLKRNR